MTKQMAKLIDMVNEDGVTATLTAGQVTISSDKPMAFLAAVSLMSKVPEAKFLEGDNGLTDPNGIAWMTFNI